MKQRTIIGLWMVCLSALLAACGGRKAETASGGQAVELRYAQRLSMVEFKDYTQVEVQNPWDTARVLQTYLLVDRTKEVPADLPKGVVVRVPLQKVVTYSAVHASLIDELGVFSGIGGICDLEYSNLEKAHEAVKKGTVVDLGDGLAPNMERMIELMPDGLLISPFENCGHGRVVQLGVPIIECADYMETSALGRAEWMRFYGRLFGVAQRADSLFSAVEKRYMDLKALAQKRAVKPTVLSELKNGTAWYVPGGRSWMSLLYQDAGAHYIFREDQHSGSVPLSFETVFDKGQNADFWLVKYNQVKDKTLQELKQDYAPYAGFKAFKSQTIYGCNTNSIRFYEEIPYHPDLFLKDLIKIFHPELLPEYNSRFFTKLAD